MPETEKRTGYLAPDGFVDELVYELKHTFHVEIESIYDRLVIASGEAKPVAWAENVWLDPRTLPVTSITDAAKKLRELAPRWSLYSTTAHRRAALIEEKIPRARGIEVEFLGAIPAQKPGSWTLLAPDLLLASPTCTSPLANGEVRFKENKTEAPSRAYLKLWELFTVHGLKPSKSERCLDLGSSPGGWSWVLQTVGAHVLSVDKAPLDPRIARLKNIEIIRQDAFTLKPETVGPVDWLFSDIICEPQRLWALVETWREQKHAKNFVCTLKFKGQTDHATAARFQAVPGSRLIHLHHNKHELTWVLLQR